MSMVQGHGVGNQRGHWTDSASVETTEKSQQIEREMSKKYSKKGGKGEERGGEGGRMRAEREMEGTESLGAVGTGQIEQTA